MRLRQVTICFFLQSLRRCGVNLPDRRAVLTGKKTVTLTVFWTVASVIFALNRNARTADDYTFGLFGHQRNRKRSSRSISAFSAYASQLAQHYRFFWVSCGGLCSLLAGGASWLIALRLAEMSIA